MAKEISGRSLNELCSSRICIDEYQDGRMRGRLYNNYYAEPIVFENVIQLLKKMEAIFDRFEHPQKTMEPRKFGNKRRNPEKIIGQDALMQRKPQEANGKVATFHVRVIFRKNASWQGIVCWVDGEKRENFRSVLELLMLMDEAMESGKTKSTENFMGDGI